MKTDEDEAAFAPKKRKGTTSFRFTDRDEQLLARAMVKAGTDKRVNAIRHALKFFVGVLGAPTESGLRKPRREMVGAELNHHPKGRGT